MPLVAALLLGVVAGMRTATAPAALAWSVGLGWLAPTAAWTHVLGSTVVRWLIAVGAVGEYVIDTLPKTPSRKRAPAFAGRIVSGAFCGATLGTLAGASGLALGALAGAAGAVIGTLGGHTARMRLARAFGRDLPAALLEDVVAIALAIVALRIAR